MALELNKKELATWENGKSVLVRPPQPVNAAETPAAKAPGKTLKKSTPAPAAEATLQSYYTPREFYTQNGTLGARVQESRAAMEQQAAALQEGRKAMEELYAEANRQRQRYYELQGRFVGDHAAEYEQRILDDWTAATRAYIQSRDAYGKAYDAYKPYEQAYNRAVTDYNAYNAQEEEAYNQWRATIRDAETIRAERAEIEKLRNELHRRMLMANDIAAGTAAPGIQAQAQQNEERIRQLQAYLGGIGDRERLLEEELGWSEYLYWEDRRQNPDFAAASQYRGNGGALQEYINEVGGGQPQAGMGFYEDFTRHKYMTADEVAMYNYVYNTQGEDAASEYLGYLSEELGRRSAQGQREATAEWAADHPVLASVGSVLLSPASGISSGIGILAARLTGEEIDPNSSWFGLSNQKNALREGVSRQIEQSLGEKWGPAGSFGYSVGMSMLDMLADKWTGIGLVGRSDDAAKIVVQTTLGSRAFSESVMDGKNRGLSDEQAMGLGLASAAAELLTERIGLDEMLHLPKDWDSAGFWKGAAKGAAGEALEEGATNLANLVADLAISGDKSEFMQNMNAYRDAGKSGEEALRAAMGDAGLSFFLDALGGAISGAGFGGFEGWRGRRAADKQQKQENAANMAAGKASENASVENEASDGAGETVSFKNPAEIKSNAKDSAAEPSLKEAALRENNPLISGIAPSVASQEKAARMAKATTNAQVTGILYDVDEQSIEQADRIGKLIGREIFFFSENPTQHGIKHGIYDQTENAIGVNVKSPNVMAATIGHELTHSVEMAKSYEELKNLVFERIGQTGESLDAMRQSRQELYRKNGVELDAQGIDREIVAKYIEDHLLTDEENIRAMVRDNRSVARRILDWLDGLLAKFGSKKSQEREFVRQSRDIYRAALAEADRIRRNQELTRAARDAYIAGDDEVGDALTDERYGDDMDSLLEDDFDAYDPSHDDELDFSFGGEKAAGADLQALKRAKEMREAGVPIRTIFRETGWYVGADRKWRFEIDDSGMRYHRTGDAQFRKDHPEYVRFRELERQFIDGTITDAEIIEMAALRSIWAGETKRLAERVERGNAVLANVLEHDVLYEQYPQLKRVKVRFGDTDDANAWWDRERNEIVVSERYRQADPAFLELRLLHEIQHVIQDIESFAGGSNTEYWEEIQNSDRAIRENDRELAQAERDAQKALEGIPPEIAKDFWYAANMMENDPEGAQEIMDRLDESEYADAFWDYDWAISTVRELLEQDNPKRAEMDLYRNTAGEIEARDAANRRGLDAETRKNRLPDTGDERTVFVEEGGKQYSIHTFDSSDETIRRNTEELAKMRAVHAVHKDKLLRTGKRPTDIFAEYFDKWGNNVFSEELGDVAMKKSSVKSEIRHGITSEKIASIEAIPAVIKSGKIVFAKFKGGSDVQRIVVCAPITIGGDPYYMGVMLQRDSQNQRLYLHNVAIENEKEANMTPQADLLTTGADGENEHLFITTILQKALEVKYKIRNRQNAGEQYSISEVDSEGRELTEEERAAFDAGKTRSDAVYEHAVRNGDMESAQRMVDEQARRSGFHPVVRWHQTKSIFHEFSNDNPSAGKNDSETPNGFFFKANDHNIGLEGRFQMPLYLKANNMLHFSDRKEANAWYRKNVPGYGDLHAQYDAEMNPFIERLDEIEDRYFETEDDDEIDALESEEDGILEKMKAVEDYYRAKLRKLLDDYFLTGKSGYDGIELDYDGHRYVNGKREDVHTYIVFEPNQAKSAKPATYDKTGRLVSLSERFDSMNRDIRYSIGEPGEMTDSERDEVNELLNRADTEMDAVAGRGTWEGIDRAEITGKAREHLEWAERQLAAKIAAALDVPRQAKREFLQPVVEELTAEYMTNGTISQEVRDRLFETAWEQGRVVDQEFYETYKEVKDYLRTTGVTLSETDRDSRDWNEFRKRAFGTVKIVNEGGLPVDTAWGELQDMAPALFPGDILNPEDMLRHMVEVGQSIRKVEKTLDEHYGSDAGYAKQITRNDFDAAIADGIYNLWVVKRSADERKAESAAVTAEDGEELTAEAVMALYPKLKDARKAAEKAVAKNLLTKHDKEQVQRLLRHDIQPEHLDPSRDNVKGILAVYEAKRAFEEAAEPIRKWNKQQKAVLYAQAEELIAGAGRIKDKKRGILYSRETMERNIRDIVRNKEAAERIIRTYFKPVHEGAAAAIRMKNEFRERVRALKLSRKVEKGNTVSEAYAVQFYGEVSDILRLMEQSKFRLKHRDGKSYLEWKTELQKLWEENPNLDQEKIKAAANEFGKIYEELFQKMNEARVRNGYEPINHRSGYFPHFQQDGRDGILGQFGKALGIDVEVQQLPTTINGLTHTFKPGIRWFGNALERKGFDTAYDAVEGFDRYIEGVADVVHQTDNIQRLRALANQLRYRTSDEGLREQIRRLQKRTDLSDEEKDALIREKTKDGKFELSNFVVELDEYTNLLANKKSRADRNMEQAMGRDMYNIVKSLEGRVAANMVAINPGSWLTNFIPITQGWACLDTRHLMGGLKDTLAAMKNDDGMMDRSDFLTGRKGTDALVKTWAQEWSGKLSSPMEWIDTFTAGSLIRGRYRQNLALGLSEEEALREADEWAAGVMADRSKGSMPTLFHRSNPLTKLFTQFQLEVNNQLSYVWKDIPREKRDKGKRALALALLKFAVGAWLYNWLYEWAFGRRPALDPIDMITGTVATAMDPEQDLADALMGLGENIAENTPFIGGLLGGGRVPISSALPDVGNLVNALGNSDWSAGKRLGTAARELGNTLAYTLPPFGGGQAKKAWEGLKMIAQGGSYTLDKDGNPMLQYPLYSSDSGVMKALEAAQAMIFGKTTIHSGREWVEGGFGSLSAEQTATYQALIGMGVEQADAFDLLTELREAEKTDDQSRATIQRDILRQAGLDGDALGTVYYDLMTEEDSRERSMLEQLLDDGADMGKVTNTVMDIKDAQTPNERRDAIMASGLTDQQKRMIYRTMISENWDEEMDAFAKVGLDVNEFLEAQNAYTDIKEQYDDEKDMATAFARWVNRQGYSAEQKAVVRDSLKYWQMMPAQATGYDKAIDAGLSDEEAYDLAQDLGALKPPEGKTSVQQIQKWRVAIDNSLSVEQQLQMLEAAGMTGSTYDRVSAAWDAGIAPGAWVRAKELEGEFDADGSGSLNNKEWQSLIDGMTTWGIVLPGDNTKYNLTQEQKGFLWQMLTGSKSTKNNPYSAKGGQQWLDVKAKG